MSSVPLTVHRPTSPPLASPRRTDELTDPKWTPHTRHNALQHRCRWRARRRTRSRTRSSTWPTSRRSVGAFCSIMSLPYVMIVWCDWGCTCMYMCVDDAVVGQAGPPTPHQHPTTHTCMPIPHIHKHTTTTTNPQPWLPTCPLPPTHTTTTLPELRQGGDRRPLRALRQDNRVPRADRPGHRCVLPCGVKLVDLHVHPLVSFARVRV